MAELKTKQHDADVHAFIESFTQTDQRRADSLALIDLMQKATGFAPKMWGASIIGFGSYHYKSVRSSQEGDWMLVGFSPRKAAISLYVFSGSKEHEHLLDGLGTFTMGKACIYIKRLSDINTTVLTKLIKATVKHLQKLHGA